MTSEIITNQFQIRTESTEGFNLDRGSSDGMRSRVPRFNLDRGSSDGMQFSIPRFKISFTYESPYMDIKQNMGLNSDSSINVQYTLATIRDNLLKNIDLLNYLLENSNVISNINLVNTDYIGININDKLKLKEMIDLNIVCEVDNNSNLQDIVTDHVDEEETHSDRLNMVYNLLCKSNADSDFSSDSDSDIISDTQKELYICNKYSELMENTDTICKNI